VVERFLLEADHFREVNSRQELYVEDFFNRRLEFEQSEQSESTASSGADFRYAVGVAASGAPVAEDGFESGGVAVEGCCTGDENVVVGFAIDLVSRGAANEEVAADVAAAFVVAVAGERRGRKFFSR